MKKQDKTTPSKVNSSTVTNSSEIKIDEMPKNSKQ
jgi:hypothetical protein